MSETLSMTITFDNPSLTYLSGQTVSGIVCVTTTKVKRFRSLRIKFKGQAITKWYTGLNNDSFYAFKDDCFRSPRCQHYVTGHEEYFRSEHYILGSSFGSQIELPPGQHNYPFSYTLLPNLPSSFEYKYGHIRYTVKVIVNRSLKFDYEVVKPFTVLSSLDLNQLPITSKPIRIQMSKTVGFCCTSLPLNLEISLPVRGYVPGQNMPVKVHIENSSGTRIKEIRIQFYKKLVLHAKQLFYNHTKTQTKMIFETLKGPFEGNFTGEFIQLVTIPPMPPSILNHCNIINLTYYIKVKVILSKCFTSNLSDETKIYIGTVPVRNYQMSVPNKMPVPLNVGFVNPLLEPAGKSVEPFATLHSELPPPTYAESMFHTDTLREDL